jgi:ribose 5-phosphate isomerase A
MLLDLRFPQPIVEPESLDAELKGTLGVVEHGLFLGMADACVLAGEDGVRVIGSFD